MTDKKYLDLQEFQKIGFLQESNRLFFHPHGLSLELQIDDQDPTNATLKIVDVREDETGMIFAEPCAEKASAVDRERRRRYPARYELFEKSDHKHSSYTVCVEHPENYVEGKMTKLKLTNPPDVQPTQKFDRELLNKPKDTP